MYFYVACSYEGGMQVEDPCRIVVAKRMVEIKGNINLKLLIDILIGQKGKLIRR
jgi:hypothetical protein